MTKHTEGPWKVPAHARFQVVQESAQLGTICLAIAHEDKYRGRTVAEAKANARLMAAAPDLLAACKTIIRAYENADVAPDALDAAYSAVRKAEGDYE